MQIYDHNSIPKSSLYNDLYFMMEEPETQEVKGPAPLVLDTVQKAAVNFGINTKTQ